VVPLATGVPMHSPAAHVSFAVHGLKSSQVPPEIGVP
jgi:hypothetical protein